MQSLADYGVAIFSMGCLVFVVLKFLQFIKHHISDSTRASQRLADMIVNFGEIGERLPLFKRQNRTRVGGAVRQPHVFWQ